MQRPTRFHVERESQREPPGARQWQWRQSQQQWRQWQWPLVNNNASSVVRTLTDNEPIIEQHGKVDSTTQ
jgi:hypothetical protein